jgi:hypothetical protein
MSPYPPKIPHVLIMALILPVAKKDSSNKLYTTACSLRNVAFLHTVKSIPKCLIKNDKVLKEHTHPTFYVHA